MHICCLMGDRELQEMQVLDVGQKMRVGEEKVGRVCSFLNYCCGFCKNYLLKTCSN